MCSEPGRNGRKIKTTIVQGPAEANIGTMMLYLCEVFGLLCLGHLLYVTEPANICQNNKNADHLIQGDTSNAVINFLAVIHETDVFALSGDTTSTSDGCRRVNEQHKHRKGRYYDGQMWILDCWETFECKMIKQGSVPEVFKLLPASASTTAPVQVRTVLLPLDQHETSSYTFLPSVTRDNILFVTAVLSGCSFFVARANLDTCNVIIIHTNYRCGEHPSIDYNHKQAITVLEEVQSTNPHCKYQIQQRWAENGWRSFIEAAGYHYPTHFYDFFKQGPNFLYGYHVGGAHGAWKICIKVKMPHAPDERCYVVSGRGDQALSETLSYHGDFAYGNYN